MKSTMTLIGGPVDGATVEAQDSTTDAVPGSVIHLPSGHADGLLWRTREVIDAQD